MKRKNVKTGVAKPPNQRARMSGVSLGTDNQGYFVYTHRARSKSYPSPEKIPDKAVKFIDSTG
jgi:hypothetical protein